jgi:hypothetical protein
MRRFEKIGLTRAQAEQMTEMLTEVVCTSKEKIAQQFVSKPALEKVWPPLTCIAAAFTLFTCAIVDDVVT